MINITKLNNGLRVINDYMDDVESVSVNIWVKTGSRNESKNINGISHFLEHMAFKGTATRNTKQIAEAFDDIGGRTNAFTSVSNTAYYTKVLKENTERAVELLSDIVQNSIFSNEEIEKERLVILQEIAMTNDDPSDLIGDYFDETAYRNQPMGRPILGPCKNVKKFTRDDIVNYVNKQYKSDNMVISFSGKLENEEAVRLAEKYFNNLKPGKIKNTDPAVYTGGYVRKNKKLEQTQLIMGFESFNHDSEYFYPMGVASIILGGGMSSRLFQEIREKRGLCYTISASNSSTYDTGVFDVYSAVSPDRVNELITATIEELQKSIKQVTEEERRRAVTKLKSNILMNREANAARAQKNAYELLMKGRITTIEEIVEKIESVNLKKIQDVISRVLTSSEPTIAILGTKNDDIFDSDVIKKKISSF